MDSGELPEAAAAELGWVTWAAILLEDVAFGVCDNIEHRSGLDDRRPPGSGTHDRSSNPGPPRRARSPMHGLSERRHAVPVVFFEPDSDGKAKPIGVGHSRNYFGHADPLRA